MAQVLHNLPCPLLGADVPAPIRPSQDAAIQAATSQFQGLLQSALGNATVSGQLDGNTSFSIDVYSTHENASVFTFHYTAPAAALDRSGTTKVDSNTIYRIGSSSKIFTVFTYLVSVGDVSWSDPVAKYVPELANGPKPRDAIKTFDWESITIGALASHLAGLPRDLPGPLYADQAIANETGLPLAYPPANVTFCGYEAFPQPCSRTDFFNLLDPITPAFRPYHSSPVYSNMAFTILSYALENITATSYEQLLSSKVLTPLGMNSSFYAVPSSNYTSQAIIPAQSIDWYTSDLGAYSPVGSMYSSINDMRKISISILNSSLMARTLTGRWLRPHSFTSNPDNAVGAPWEITRAQTNRTTYIYAKEGGINVYESEIALLPDFDAGFTVLVAGSDGSAVSADTEFLTSLAAQVFVPAFEQAAKEEATAAYVGNYTSQAIDATLILTVDDADVYPGLKISSITVDGQDFSPVFLGETVPDGERASLRMYPSGLHDASTVEWRIISQLLPISDSGGAFSQACATWAYATSQGYGNFGLDEVLFTLDGNGKASQLELAAFDQGNGTIIFERES